MVGCTLGKLVVRTRDCGAPASSCLRSFSFLSRRRSLLLRRLSSSRSPLPPSLFPPPATDAAAMPLPITPPITAPMGPPMRPTAKPAPVVPTIFTALIAVLSAHAAASHPLEEAAEASKSTSSSRLLSCFFSSSSSLRASFSLLSLLFMLFPTLSVMVSDWELRLRFCWLSAGYLSSEIACWVVFAARLFFSIAFLRHSMQHRSKNRAASRPGNGDSEALKSTQKEG